MFWDNTDAARAFRGEPNLSDMVRYKRETYNGWANYETWCVKVWIDNEEGTYREWMACAQECYDLARPTDVLTREENATIHLEELLREQLREEMPALGATMWSDLLSAALHHVEWREIAKSLMETARGN